MKDVRVLEYFPKHLGFWTAGIPYTVEIVTYELFGPFRCKVREPRRQTIYPSPVLIETIRISEVIQAALVSQEGQCGLFDHVVRAEEIIDFYLLANLERETATQSE